MPSTQLLQMTQVQCPAPTSYKGPGSVPRPTVLLVQFYWIWYPPFISPSSSSCLFLSLLLPLSSLSPHHSSLSASSPSGSLHLFPPLSSTVFSPPLALSVLCSPLPPPSPLALDPMRGAVCSAIDLDALPHHKLGMVTSETTTQCFTLTTTTSTGLGMNIAGAGSPHK